MQKNENVDVVIFLFIPYNEIVTKMYSKPKNRNKEDFHEIFKWLLA